jgi:hypothetical protein
MLVDDVEKLGVSAAASVSPHPSVANYFNINLTDLLTMTQELIVLFGLRLPLSF